MDKIKLVNISPAYYSDGNVPVFKPTMAEFENFYDYIVAITEYGAKSGIAKVIPPPEWNGNNMDIQEKLKNIIIKKPIRQHFDGKQGEFKQSNVEARKVFNVEDFKRLSFTQEFKPYAPNSGATNRKALPIKRRGNQLIKNNKLTSVSTESSHFQEPKNLGIPITPPGNSSPNKSVQSQNPTCIVEEVDKNIKKANIFKGARKYKPTKKELIENVIVPEYDGSIYTDEFLKEVERNYWRNIAFSTPYYGADLSGSLFSDDVKSWNVSNLGDLLQKVGTKLPGVNSPYLYFGMWKATFAWHVEDMNLFSINYIHEGAPKQWYSISPEHKIRFEDYMKNAFGRDGGKCKEFLRHKTYMVSPSRLSNHNIPVNKIVHFKGEFMITFPHGYHSGYNLGFNIAESINFATRYWLRYGRIANSCQCISDSVKIDMSSFDQFEIGSPESDMIVDDLKNNYDLSAGEMDSSLIVVHSPNKDEDIVQLEGNNNNHLNLLNIDESKQKKRASNKKKGNTVKKGRIEPQISQETAALMTNKEIDNKFNLPIGFKKAPVCDLCRSLEGDLIHSLNFSLFAHPICAQFIDGVEVVKVEQGEDYLRGFPAKIYPSKTKCYRCHRQGGVFIECSEGGCGRLFHVSCVPSEKLIQKDNKNFTYCMKHGPKVNPPAVEPPWQWPIDNSRNRSPSPSTQDKGFLLNHSKKANTLKLPLHFKQSHEGTELDIIID